MRIIHMAILGCTAENLQDSSRTFAVGYIERRSGTWNVAQDGDGSDIRGDAERWGVTRGADTMQWAQCRTVLVELIWASGWRQYRVRLMEARKPPSGHYPSDGRWVLCLRRMLGQWVSSSASFRDWSLSQVVLWTYPASLCLWYTCHVSDYSSAFDGSK